MENLKINKLLTNIRKINFNNIDKDRIFSLTFDSRSSVIQYNIYRGKSREDDHFLISSPHGNINIIRHFD